jgi:hypothetical protein
VANAATEVATRIRRTPATHHGMPRLIWFPCSSSTVHCPPFNAASHQGREGTGSSTVT